MRKGLTLIELVVTLAILALVAGLLIAAAQKIRTAAAKGNCLNVLRQLSISVQSHVASKDVYPPGVGYQTGKDPTPFAGWTVHLLPFLEQEALYKLSIAAFRDDPVFWNMPPHVGAGTVVPAFLCPADSRVTQPKPVGLNQGMRGFTSYLGVVGRNAGIVDGLLYIDSKHRPSDVRDGTSNTLLIGERPPSATFKFGWWYAGWGQDKNGDADLVLGVRTRNYSPYGLGCPDGPYEFVPGSFDDPCAAFHFWSPHPGGAHFVFADGSVRFLCYSANDILPALATRAVGETVQIPD
jgi:prepilin-type N-terminal cleavage/methylation domain-containing protein/prepilin-type processing-associated H-X9-DG protein